jgi:hypothetical protein
VEINKPNDNETVIYSNDKKHSADRLPSNGMPSKKTDNTKMIAKLTHDSTK